MSPRTLFSTFAAAAEARGQEVTAPETAIEENAAAAFSPP
jgi:hypothetical protein